MACTYAAGGGECDTWGFSRSAPSVQRDGRIERMAEAMKLPDPDAVGPAIREMNRRLGLPAGLSEIGVSESVFPKIIAGALPTTLTRPIPARQQPRIIANCSPHRCSAATRSSTP